MLHTASIYEKSFKGINDHLVKRLRDVIVSRTLPPKEGTLFYVQWNYDLSLKEGSFPVLAEAFTKGKNKLIKPYGGGIYQTLSSPCKYQWSDGNGHTLTYGLNIRDNYIYLQIESNF